MPNSSSTIGIGPVNQRMASIAAAGWSGTWSGVAVSLFDVTSPAAPKLLGQANIGDAAWSSALYDDKAFQIVDALGLPKRDVEISVVNVGAASAADIGVSVTGFSKPGTFWLKSDGSATS